MTQRMGSFDFFSLRCVLRPESTSKIASFPTKKVEFALASLIEIHV